LGAAPELGDAVVAFKINKLSKGVKRRYRKVPMNDGASGHAIGLVGGLGVGAAVFYYQELAQAHAARGRVLNLAMIHAHNIRVREFIESGDIHGLADYLAALIGRLQAAGAEFAVVPAVAPHIAISELSELSPLPLVSLIAEVSREIASRQLRRVALFGTRYAVDSQLFGQLGGVEVVTPQPDEIRYIHTTYFQIVDAGAATAEQHDGLTRLAHKLIERDRVEAIVLAGTDLTLVFDESNTDFPHIDAARLHVNAIVERATGPRT
jgi:aspartate racemase